MRLIKGWQHTCGTRFSPFLISSLRLLRHFPITLFERCPASRKTTGCKPALRVAAAKSSTSRGNLSKLLHHALGEFLGSQSIT
jgi:hypothetical protein